MKGVGIRALTPKQEAFAKLVADGSDKANAYRIAYNSGFSKQGLATKGSETAKRPAVAARIAELKADVRKLELWSKEDSIRALINVINDPDKKSDVVTAVKELNNMHGFNSATELKHTGDIAITQIVRKIVDATSD
jgi:phage terminase small subunit